MAVYIAVLLDPGKPKILGVRFKLILAYTSAGSNVLNAHNVTQAELNQFGEKLILTTLNW